MPTTEVPNCLLKIFQIMSVSNFLTLCIIVLQIANHGCSLILKEGEKSRFKFQMNHRNKFATVQYNIFS